jgi:hypothetical protein
MSQALSYQTAVNSQWRQYQESAQRKMDDYLAKRSSLMAGQGMYSRRAKDLTLELKGLRADLQRRRASALRARADMDLLMFAIAAAFATVGYLCSTAIASGAQDFEEWLTTAVKSMCSCIVSPDKCSDQVVVRDREDMNDDSFTSHSNMNIINNNINNHDSDDASQNSNILSQQFIYSAELITYIAWELLRPLRSILQSTGLSLEANAALSMSYCCFALIFRSACFLVPYVLLARFPVLGRVADAVILPLGVVVGLKAPLEAYSGFVEPLVSILMWHAAFFWVLRNFDPNVDIRILPLSWLGLFNDDSSKGKRDARRLRTRLRFFSKRMDIRRAVLWVFYPLLFTYLAVFLGCSERYVGEVLSERLIRSSSNFVQIFQYLFLYAGRLLNIA